MGRSNVGKSSLINSLVRQPVARTSSTPGKTRLANVYRVARGAGTPFYLVDLPGYGFARGGSDDFQAITRAFFGQDRLDLAALLIVDSRHPGLQSDSAAWRWLHSTVDQSAVVGDQD